MSAKRDRIGKASKAAGLIHQHIGRPETARFLRRLPGLEIDRELPTHLLELLGKLHNAEKMVTGGHRGSGPK